MDGNWKYGNAWDEFPIEKGEVWGIPDNDSKVSVHDIFNPLPNFMFGTDLIFVDPPWNQSNITCFYTKAEKTDYQKFEDFILVLFKRFEEINPNTLYIEIGNQFVDDFYSKLTRMYPYLQRWPVVYYRKHPTWIIRGSKIGEIDYDFTGIDEAKCIDIISKIEDYKTIGDLCMGLGLVGLSAYKAGKQFVGTELNKRRLANLLQRLSKIGAKVVKYED